MQKGKAKEILNQYKDGKISEEEALLFFKQQPFIDLEFAKIDLHRGLRQGAPEVIYGAGKTDEQVLKIVKVMKEREVSPILITRSRETTYELLSKELNEKIFYEKRSGCIVVGDFLPKDGNGTIVVATAGTSDIPVAEEAAITAEVFGNEVMRLYDVGVAGIHRLLEHVDDIMKASVIIAIAGMEGALASVVGGLADCPVIAVPTSVGYGASFEGLTALLAMLNSCASGISVVNIDNGFGAGYQAGMINHPKKN